MPQFNAMHAPIWLYGYYIVIQFLFYGFLDALGITESVPGSAAIGSAQSACARSTLEECE